MFFSRQVLEVSKDGGCAKGLCPGWGSAARGDRDRFCPGLLDSGCGTALCSRRQQVWIPHGRIIKVTPRPLVNIHEPLSAFYHLSSQFLPFVFSKATDATVHAVDFQKFIHFFHSTWETQSWSMWVQFKEKWCGWDKWWEKSLLVA